MNRFPSSFSKSLVRGSKILLLLLGLTIAPAALAQVQDASSSDSSAGFSNFQNTPVASILDNYEQLSGKHLIRDVTLTSLSLIHI